MSASGCCRTCGAALLERPVFTKEMMFGTRETFEYHECSGCGCLQIAEYPADIARHYPSGYYSLGSPGGQRAGRLARWARASRARHALGRLDPVGLGLSLLRPAPEYYAWFRPAGLSLRSSILDVGCGEGHLLAYLRDEGFRVLRGVDPHAREEARHQAGFDIEPKLEEVRGEFDFVLLSHSLEHMPDQASVFRELRRLSHRTTTICIRIPILSHAWKAYGADWVQLDAPRHFYLHTPKSLEKLASTAGFRVHGMRCDSTAFQFWGSELYKRDIPLHDESGRLRAPDSQFSSEQIAAWERRASELNRVGDGDQAIFHLGVA